MPKVFRKKTIVALSMALMAGYLNPAYANLFDVKSPLPIHINGFATVAGGISNSNQPYKQPEAGDIQNHFQLNDSLVGLQATVDFTPKLSFTGQLVATYINNFQVDANWAFLKYQFTPTWSVSAGRFRIPVYMYRYLPSW